jgi:hypothetical protein
MMISRENRKVAAPQYISRENRKVAAPQYIFVSYDRVPRKSSHYITNKRSVFLTR